MHLKLFLFLTFTISISHTDNAHATETKKNSLCSNGRITANSNAVSLNPSELLLICGDRRNQTPEWQSIPLRQSEVLIREFAKARGFYSVQFHQSPQNELYIEWGLPSRIRTIEIEGYAFKTLEIEAKNWENSILSASTLNEIEAWVKRQMQQNGYPCCDVKLKAQLNTESLQIEITPGLAHRIPTPKLINLDPKIHSQVIRRYDAFSQNTPYDIRRLEMSTRRIEADGLFLSSEFTSKCQNSEIYLEQSALIGPPRILSFGFGATTEEFPLIQGQLRSLRIDQNASSTELRIRTSQRRQEGVYLLKYYPLKNIERVYFEPSVRVTRRLERSYEYFQMQAAADLGTTLDFTPGQLQIRTGPALSHLRTLKGPRDLEHVRFMTWDVRAQWRSTLFEYYLNQPQQGTMLELITSSILPAGTINTTAHRLSLLGTHHFPLVRRRPPDWVLSLRHSFNTTLTQALVNTRTALPVTFFHFLGGDADMRGFKRQELPLNGIGALTSVYIGGELRWVNRSWFEPFLLADFAMIGLEKMQLENTVFASPGVGLRLRTPFGAIRSTFARGYELPRSRRTSQLEHYQFFVSLGQEF